MSIPRPEPRAQEEVSRPVPLGHDDALKRVALLCGALASMAVISVVVLTQVPRMLDRPALRATSGGASSLAFRSIDDDRPDSQGERFTYLGLWEHTEHVRDGRSHGTSTRSYHVGDTATLEFTGRRFALFGVLGTSGGYADLSVDGKTATVLRFYAPRKRAGVRIYTSGALEPGHHTVKLVVVAMPGGDPKRRFVNIDGGTVDSGRS